MSSPAALVLIRHGATEWNQDGRYQGHSDPPLSAAGLAQAAELARGLRHLQLSALYASDLQRATATATPLARAHNLSVQLDPRLRELHFGAWEGRPAAAVWATDRERQAAWYADPIHRAPPGGETVAMLWERVCPALAQIAAAHPGTVAVVTHGGVIRSVLAWLASGRPWTAAPLPSVPNGGWLFLTPAMAGRLAQSRPGPGAACSGA